MNSPATFEGIELLVVDDDPDVVAWLVEMFLARGHKAEGCLSADAALQRLERAPVDVVVSDLEMPGCRGIELLERIRRSYPEVLVILITAFGSVETAMQAVHSGAADFLTKPFHFEALELAVEQALGKRDLKREVVRLRSRMAQRAVKGGIVAESASMKRIIELLERAAGSNVPVLLTGESGTGKGRLARFVHDESPRRKGPFVQLNCAALPASLAEAELFGARAGAFTDARKDRPGLFEQADGGTLFLDEIGELPLEVQPKLLQALETLHVRPVGGASEVRVDVRVIAATNQPLEVALREQRFRPDLYFRLNVVRAEVPPLRERREDLGPLLDQLLAESCQRHGRTVIGVEAQARERLMRHEWPGNVRELANAIERAVALGRGEILRLDDLALDGIKPAAVGAMDEAELTLEEVERRHVRRTLDAVGGNKSEAARKLGIDRRTLYRKLEEWGPWGP